MLSVDISIDRARGDLSNDRNLRRLIDGIRQGRIRASIAGPPCATWTKARWIELLLQCATGREPRPPRDMQYPWGKRGLTRKELQQVSVGNTQHIFLELLITGGVSILEHPECPREACIPSIWRLPITSDSQSSDTVSRVDFDQCQTGQKSTKPTSLLLLRLPYVEQQIRDLPGGGRCTHGKQHEPSKGRGEDGQWKTASLKTYRPALCTILATGMVRSLVEAYTGRPVDGPPDLSDLEEHLRVFYAPLNPYVEVEQSLQPDYAGTGRRRST